MAAADCAKSQDSSTDTVMPVEMQRLKEVLDRASKKPLIKGTKINECFFICM